MKRKNNILLILGIIAIVIISLTLYLSKYLNKTPQQNSMNFGQTKIFQSKNLNLSLQISNKLQVLEKTTFVNLISQDRIINVSRIATNFDDISSYLKDFDSKRTVKIEQEHKLKINDYPSVDRMELFNNGPVAKQKVYYIYINNWIYSLSTSSESLYDDLDQIAQSFRYTP